MLNLAGVFIPNVTPFDPVTGDVDVVALRSNVRAWAGSDIRGIVVGGSTGEAVFLDAAERRACVSAVRDVLPDGRIVIAGTGTESTRGTIALTRDAADAGADAVLVSPPAFYRGAMTPPALVRHYRAVADASPVPVIVYQVPLRLGTLEFPAGVVAELSRHDNIVGIKDSRGSLERLAELLEQCARGFQVLVGNGAYLYAALEMGAVGGILGVANLAPAESAALVAAFEAGRTSEAGRLQERIGPLHQAVVGALGVPGVKVGVDLLGLKGGDPRPPLAPLGDDGRRSVHQALQDAGVLQGGVPAAS